LRKRRFPQSCANGDYAAGYSELVKRLRGLTWPHFTYLLRNDKPVHFQYDDSDNTAQISSVRAAVPGGSSRFADRFIKAHFLSRQKPQDRQGA
jgi:hypothetical protein